MEEVEAKIAIIIPVIICVLKPGAATVSVRRWPLPTLVFEKLPRGCGKEGVQSPEARDARFLKIIVFGDKMDGAYVS